MDDPEQRWEQIAGEITEASSPDALEQVRINLLGRRGSLTQAMRVLGELGPEERRRVGAQLNELKDRAAAEIEARAAVLHRAALANRLAGSAYAVPLDRRAVGKDEEGGRLRVAPGLVLFGTHEAD